MLIASPIELALSDRVMNSATMQQPILVHTHAHKNIGRSYYCVVLFVASMRALSAVILGEPTINPPPLLFFECEALLPCSFQFWILALNIQAQPCSVNVGYL